MRRVSIFSLLFLVGFLGFAYPGWSSEIAAAATPARKLQRGFLNIALSGIELSDQLARLRKFDQQELALPQWALGSIRGVFYTAARMLTGVYEMFTFPFSRGGYSPVVKPEFVWEYFPSAESQTLTA